MWFEEIWIGSLQMPVTSVHEIPLKQKRRGKRGVHMERNRSLYS